MRNKLIFDDYQGNDKQAKRIQEIFDHFDFGIYISYNNMMFFPHLNISGNRIMDVHLSPTVASDRYFLFGRGIQKTEGPPKKYQISEKAYIFKGYQEIKSDITLIPPKRRYSFPLDLDFDAISLEDTKP